ncbi:enoyl-CoA hydratase/isomerase family protein [Leifsonia sp. H3M29-4]|uniref:enoyl-CoA hydratase/isomerase family protein n=1 Tax=Salinibacterium metalliresistens TaxID=3031321 RepID=UPI0023D98A32|nr:enoyl-CoA hydratase/isomerase family protein [Salinibacterium metalliresistens]MDF1479325.1 enoyl-CoA hydratase/isomerase family protein [Salinibacterium metalliresistens]
MSAVVFERRGRLGIATLNRPAALNALTHEMVVALQSQLDDWRDDDAVQAVALTGAGDRGFCAGGDIVAIYHDAREGGTASVDFWRDEYVLNAAIARYPKPVVAFMDGIVLGGGIGLAAHASHRVVTERSSVGLPETTIGFVPDVGGTYLLSRAPGELGTHLALTAGSVGGADAIALGLADVFVPAERLPQLAATLEAASPDEAISIVAITPPPSPLLAQRDWIDAAYAGDDLTTILERLDALGTPEAATAAQSIRRKSPTALLVTLAALRRARRLPDLESVLDQELRVSVHALSWPDLAEGIRAQVIDKDRTPAWRPASIDAVDPTDVQAAFAPLDVELGLGR